MSSAVLPLQPAFLGSQRTLTQNFLNQSSKCLSEFSNKNVQGYYNFLPNMQLSIVPVGGGYYNDGMEIVWHGEFSRFFGQFYPPHLWYLSITSQKPSQNWKFHRDSAKVRFCCQECGNGWTSMKGRVTFWFNLNPITNEGTVHFKLYGQQCKKCNNGKFEYVMWYPEEISKVMCNLYHKIGLTYYGFLQPPIRIDRRPGRPRNQHNSELCQACKDGECDQIKGRLIKPISRTSNEVPNAALSSSIKTSFVHQRQPVPSIKTPPTFFPIYSGSNTITHDDFNFSPVPPPPFIIPKVVPFRSNEFFDSSKFNKNCEKQEKLYIKQTTSKSNEIAIVKNKGSKIERNNVVEKGEAQHDIVEKIATDLDKLNIKNDYNK